MRSLSGLGADRPALDAPGGQIEDGRQKHRPVPRRHPGDVTNGPGPGLDTGKVPLAIGAQAVIGDMSGEERLGSRLAGSGRSLCGHGVPAGALVPHQAIARPSEQGSPASPLIQQHLHGDDGQRALVVDQKRERDDRWCHTPCRAGRAGGCWRRVLDLVTPAVVATGLGRSRS